MQHVAVQHRRDYFAAIDAVAIDFAVGGPAGIKLRAGFFRLHDADRGREDGVQGALKFLRGKRGLRAEAADLAEGVDASIGAAGAVQRDVCSCVRRRRTSMISPWMVGLFFWICQPWKSVPS